MSVARDSQASLASNTWPLGSLLCLLDSFKQASQVLHMSRLQNLSAVSSMTLLYSSQVARAAGPSYSP